MPGSVVEYAEELLEASQKQAVDDHLGDCAECRVEKQQLFALQDSLRANARTVGEIDLQELIGKPLERTYDQRTGMMLWQPQASSESGIGSDSI